MARLQAAVDQAQTAMVMIDRDFIVTYANGQTLALLAEHEKTFQTVFPGFKASADYMIGVCIDTFHKDPSHQRKMMDDPNNLPYSTDINVAHLKFSLNVNAILDAEGEYIGNTLEWEDVTQVREQENNVARLQAAVDQAQTAMVMIDRDFIITYANEQTMQLLSKHERTFQGVWPEFKASADFMIGVCIDMFHKNPAHQRKMLDNPNNLPYSTDITIADLQFKLDVAAILDADGNYIGNTLEWQDVTQLRQREIEVGRLASAVEGMTTNLMMADLDGNIVYMNPSLETLLRSRERELQSLFSGFKVDEVIGKNYDIFHKNPAHQRSILSDPNRLPYTAEVKVGPLDFRLTAIAMRDAAGNHIGAALQWEDLTEMKDAENQVQNLIEAAVAGELDKRMDTSKYQGFMANLGDGVNQLLDAVVSPLNSCVDVMSAVAEGDLSNDMSGDFEGDFKTLAEAVNSSVGNLREMVTKIIDSSGRVTGAANEIAEGNADLSQRTEEQASSLEETAASIEELTVTVNKNAENAQQATTMAASASDKAEKGGEVVGDTVKAMSEINTASKKISDIIGVIDEIAFQTNLLALNAAVEAARAGEQGRGFAVVAAEVRNLAQRSAGAAKEIKGLINDSVEKVGEGTRLVDESGKTLSEIVEAVKEVTTIIGDIDVASQEQASGIDQVNQAIGQMDEMTQQNAALVEEATASSESLLDDANDLVDLMDFFENDAEEEEAPRRSRKATKGKSNPQAKRAKKIRSPKRGAKQADDEWDEF